MKFNTYEESSDGKEYYDGKRWHVKPSVARQESRDYELHIVKTEKANLRHAPSGKVIGKTNKVTFNDGSVRYFRDDELSTGFLKDF